ncbi:MAG: hypothetical protein F6K17_39770, partial [Okeania sp. SIO3C4]|nr:hypothetical protein [Okeania sp. SIO3C4]
LHFGGSKAEGRRQKAEGKKRLKGIKFFITDPSEHDIIFGAELKSPTSPPGRGEGWVNF